MSFIQHLQSFRQRTAVAVVIFTSVSFYGCTTSGRSCTIHGYELKTSADNCIAASAETDPLHGNQPVTGTTAEYDLIGGPMNESASLPMHMTE
ncbi:hypothetical protein LZZ85_03655 [Terrimonas sp. NA20]|uniref:TraV family lipoprotein n=1 Tax=Terrimonas ginsenosidimutans TaxID=2908004 RepID=A0ABS9KM08_9BACT|nr:hypothetical protein [Terrimonas ginsenosidimutans]MCG2613356.1 hypothetical protein [Terrimonas ginsenosidimutans]